MIYDDLLVNGSTFMDFLLRFLLFLGFLGICPLGKEATEKQLVRPRTWQTNDYDRHKRMIPQFSCIIQRDRNSLNKRNRRPVDDHKKRTKKSSFRVPFIDWQSVCCTRVALNFSSWEMETHGQRFCWLPQIGLTYSFGKASYWCSVGLTVNHPPTVLAILSISLSFTLPVE